MGGAVKRTLDRFVSHGKDIPNAEIAFEALKETEKLVKMFYISPKEIERIQQELPDNLIALPGTMRVHQIVTPNKDHCVLYRDLSCFCGTKKACCQCYEPKTHKLISTLEPSRKRKNKISVTNFTTKRKRCDSTSDSDSDDITYAESDDSIYYEEESMLAEYLDTEELDLETVKIGLEARNECMQVFDEETELETESVENKVQTIDKTDDGSMNKGIGKKILEADKIQLLEIKTLELEKKKEEKLKYEQSKGVKDNELMKTDTEVLEIETEEDLTIGTIEDLEIETVQNFEIETLEDVKIETLKLFEAPGNTLGVLDEDDGKLVCHVAGERKIETSIPNSYNRLNKNGKEK